MGLEEVMLGLAAGDMLGAPMEFKTPGQVRTLYGEVIGPVEKSLGVFGAGEFTDDTQMALCLLAAYPADDGLVARAEAACKDWLAAGPRDVGGLTRQALRSSGVAAWRASGWQACGNGAVMRATASVAAGRSGHDLLVDAVLLGAITHADPRSLLCCAVLCAGLRALVDGAIYAEAWTGALAAAESIDLPGIVAPAFGNEYAQEVRDLRDGSLAEVAKAVRAALAGKGGGNSGYAVTTLQTAIAHGGAGSFAEGVLPVVRQGDDSDTVGAVTGAILAARSLLPPREWLVNLRCGERWSAWPVEACGEDAIHLLRQACRRAAGV